MTAISLSGKELAASIRQDTTTRAAALAEAGIPVKLAVVVATADESSAWYVRSIAKAAQKAGISCDIVDLGENASLEAIRDSLERLSADNSVHGIILQTPLPENTVPEQLASSLAFTKDVDGANPISLGRLMAKLPSFAPATAQAVVELLEYHEIPIAGQHVAIIGRSTVVGKPAAHLLLDRDATVTVCHSKTADLAAITSTADVLVVAAGRAGLITEKHVKPGATVIDVGTNPTLEGGLTGDVDADSVSIQAGGLSPVPGGVGPVTTALLLRHTVIAAEKLSQTA